MDVPHLKIVKTFDQKLLFQKAVENLTNRPVYSMEHNCSSSCIWTTSYVDNIQSATQTLLAEEDERTGVYYLVQNPVKVNINEEMQSMSVSYPMNIWLVLKQSDSLQSSKTYDLMQHISMLRFFIAHLQATLGSSAVSFFKERVQQVAEAEQGFRCFLSEKDAPGPVPWKKNKRPTFLKFHAFVSSEAMESPPIVAFKYHFHKPCETPCMSKK